GCPVGRPDPRVAPGAYRADGFAITLWTFYDAGAEVSAAAYGAALHRLHAGMRTIPQGSVPHALDRVSAARRLLGDSELTPDLPDGDRELLVQVLADLPAELDDRDRGQLLHGEPHAGNLLSTAQGPMFIDLETVCRGPIEFDLAH